MKILLQTRVGFESEACAEIAQLFPDAEVHASQAGVIWVAHPQINALWQRWPNWNQLAFARECLLVQLEIHDLPRGQRVQALQADWPKTLAHLPAHFYAPDTEATRKLAPMTAALQAEFDASRTDTVPNKPARTSAHAVFLNSNHCVLGLAVPPKSAPVASGIPRLKFPSSAPSRSTLKLDEAFLLLMSDAERSERISLGMTAVDLGACPGGWTYQLLRRGMSVVAIDHGRIDEALMRTGRVTHLRSDGFKYVPSKPVDWLVCDMVESPLKVAALASTWFKAKLCHSAVINLKLPMQNRTQTLVECRAIMQAANPDGVLRIKQLYHDREEITVLMLAPRAAAKKRRR